MKILKSKYDVNDFLFYKGRSTGTIIAVYKVKIFMEFFSFPILTNKYDNLQIGSKDWVQDRMDQIKPIPEMVSTLKSCLRLIETEPYSRLNTEFKALVSLVDVLFDFSSKDIIFKYGEYISNGKIDSPLFIEHGPSYCPSIIKINHGDIPVKSFKEIKNNKYISDFAYTALGDSTIFKYLLNTILDHENNKE